MIKVENIEITGFEAAVRGARNPLNSWSKSDSHYIWQDNVGEKFVLGPNDLDLMRRLYKAGESHAKYLRMIHVTMDVTAPLYWWKEADQYKVGTTTNSCSTMHKITSKEIELSDFSMDDFEMEEFGIGLKDCFINVVADCEMLRKKYLETNDKRYWRGLIQLLPSSYNQKRTWDFDYQTALNMIHQRTGHKLSEWNEFVEILKSLPHISEIMGE